MLTRSMLPAAVLLASFALPAMAQSRKPAPPLQGPTVKDSSVPGENRRLVPGGGGKGDRIQREVPHRAFMAAFNALRGERADPATRLTDDQDDAIRAMDQEHQTAIEAYKQSNAAEVRDLLTKLSPEDRKRVGEFLGNRRPGTPLRPDARKTDQPAARPSDNPTDAMDPMQPQDPKAAEDARARMRELVEGAPQVADTHAKMVAVLTQAQRPVFQAELERLKKDMADRRSPAKIDRDINKKNPDGAPKGDAPKTGEPANLDEPRVPNTARQRIKVLPPDQQREALRRLKGRLPNADPK